MIPDLATWKRICGPQLDAVGFPESLITQLYSKIAFDVYDVGEFFAFNYDNQSELRQRFPGRDGYYITATKPLPPLSEVFLIDHALTTSVRDGRRHLEGDFDAYSRLLHIMDIANAVSFSLIEGDGDDGNDESVTNSDVAALSAEDTMAVVQTALRGSPAHLVLDDEPIASLYSIDLSSHALLTLSLWGTQISDITEVIPVLKTLQLKALWLNDTPWWRAWKQRQSRTISTPDEEIDTILTELPTLELLNSKATPTFGEWALCHLAGVTELSRVVALDLSDRSLQQSHISMLCDAFLRMPRLGTLNLWGNALANSPPAWVSLTSVLASQNTVHSLRLPCSWSDILALNEQQPYWSSLRYLNGWSLTWGWELLMQVAELSHHSCCGAEEQISSMCQRLFTYAGYYKMERDQDTVWYVEDEVGCRMRHQGDQPNMVVAPLYLQEEPARVISIAWNVEAIALGEIITRNFLPNRDLSSLEATLTLSLWQGHTLPDLLASMASIPHSSSTSTTSAPLMVEPSFRIGGWSQALPPIPRDRPYPIYTDEQALLTALRKSTLFELVDPTAASCLWQSEVLQGMLGEDFAPRIINQFPLQKLLTHKQWLPLFLQRHQLSHFQPLTFNLNEALPTFISHYLKEERENPSSNYWILKPFKLARAIDMLVTKDLPTILRCADANLMIAQQYVVNPVLTEHKFKFDVRFLGMIGLDGQIGIYHRCFPRTATSAFGMERLEDRAIHNTTYNYDPHLTVKNRREAEFAQLFDAQGLDASWSVLVTLAHQLIFRVLDAFVREVKSRDDASQSAHSIAVFGFDIMFAEGPEAGAVLPLLLEVNHGPDQNRILGQEPAVYDDVLSFLLLNRDPESILRPPQ
jgi:tubulin--tyrosine ligase-like protein 12